MSNTVSRKDEELIREVIEDVTPAMRDRDAERITSRYAPDVVMYDLAPPLRRPASETLDPQRRRDWFAGFEGPIGYEIRDLAVTAGTDLAYAHSVNLMSATPVGSPQGFELWFRATYCLRRDGDRWLIAHEHTSTPFHMDGTFRAALDLRP